MMVVDRKILRNGEISYKVGAIKEFPRRLRNSLSRPISRTPSPSFNEPIPGSHIILLWKY